MIEILLASLHENFSAMSENKKSIESISDTKTQTITKKILIVAPAWVGDIVMAHSLFQLLKVKQNATLHILAPKSTLALTQHMPEIEKVFEIPCKHGEVGFAKRRRLGKNLQNEHYDQAILLSNTLKAALIPFFAKIPMRTGWKGEQRYILLNDLRNLDKGKYPLMVQRFAALAFPKNAPPLQVCPKPKLSVALIQLETCKEKFHLNLAKPILALCPGAAFGPAKRWPPHYFAEVAKQKLEQGYQVWILGGPGDEELANAIGHYASGCITFVGKTSLNEAVVLLSLANIVVTNDSGLMHIAAALQKPIVAIFGSSSPKFTPPLSETARLVSIDLPCRPCFQRTCPLQHLRCLKNLKPKLVLDAMDKLIS